MKTYTIQQISEEQQVHPDTVRRALKSGQLRGTRHRFGWRITEADYRAWLSRGDCPADRIDNLRRRLARA